MAIAYPDIIGNYSAAQERYAFGGIHFAGYYEHPTIAAGEVTNLFLFVQNNLNVPVKTDLQLIMPMSGGFLRKKKPLLSVSKPEISLELAPAEAGLLTVPITTTEHTSNGEHTLAVTAKTTPQGRGQRIRPEKARSKLDNQLIDSPVGLDLVASLGATYQEKSVKKAPFPLTIGGKPRLVQRAPQMEFAYETVWTEENAKIFNQAVQEINSRQVKLKEELDVEKVYVNMYGEGVARFADCGLPLRIGEAITLAKILTYSCHYFISNPQRSNGLLVPIWERAFEAKADTTDTLTLLRTVGFHHVVQLAVAISFGLIGRAFKKQYWSAEERRAVSAHIADNLELGQPLDIEFLYLPMLMAGTQISGKVKMHGEDIQSSLTLMKTAREARTVLFSDDDMAKADKIYNRILKKALA